MPVPGRAAPRTLPGMSSGSPKGRIQTVVASVGPARGSVNSRGHSPPHPDPGCEAAIGESPPDVGVVVRAVVETGCSEPWSKSSTRPWRELSTRPERRHLRHGIRPRSPGHLIESTFNVPVPCPPVAAPHSSQVIPVTVMSPVAHPTVRLVGRTCGAEPGPQDITAGCGAKVRRLRMVVDTCAVVVEAPMAVDFVVDGEELEPIVNPMAIPTPTAKDQYDDARLDDRASPHGDDPGVFVHHGGQR